MLDVAVSGIYPEAMVAPVPPESGAATLCRVRRIAPASLVRMTPELRSTVRFARLNLMEAPYPVEREMDIIFCRNILIYFDKETQEAVLQHLTEHLRPGGFLFLGHSETVAGFQLPVDPVGPTVFQRR